jgi:4-amino-4-deoxy-L-arabinose transferase-like glycosyltransferase
MASRGGPSLPTSAVTGLVESSSRRASAAIREVWRHPLALALLVAIVVVDVSWIAREHRSPPWDQAHYLDVMWRYRTALNSNGLSALVHTIRGTDPNHAPLYPILAFPFSYLFGDGVRSALVLNLLLLPILVVSSGEIAASIFGSRARLLSMFLVATTPIIVGLSHEVLQDFLLTTVVAVAVLCLLKARWLTRTSACLCAGVAMGIGMLTKVTFLLYVLGPLLVCGIAYVMSVWRRAQPGTMAGSKTNGFRALRPGVVNSLYMVGIATAIAAPWYVTNWSPTVDYLRSTTSGPLVIGVGPANPFQIREVISFTQTVLEADLSWLLTIVGVVALLLALPRFLAWTRRREDLHENLMRAAFLVTWAGVPFSVFTFSSDHDPRYLAATLPAVAIIIAGLIIQIRRTWLRTAMVAAAVGVGLFETALLTTAFHPPVLPDSVVVGAPTGVATIPLAGQPIGYERRPEPVDYALPIVDYLVAKSRVPAGNIVPRKICILETDPVVNGNTLGWLADVDELPFTYFDQFITSSSQALLSKLASCDFALYIPPEKVPEALRKNRVALLNERSAASRMTPQMFALFSGPSRRFSLESGQQVTILERTAPMGTGAPPLP